MEEMSPKKKLIVLFVVLVIIPGLFIAGVTSLFKKKPLTGEARSSQDFREYSTKQTKKYPITKVLPYIDWYFRVDYGVSQKYPDSPDAVALYVTVQPEDKQKVLEWFKNNKFNINDYEVIYRER
jgi:hypothetical protein